jgi:hypothetical protein
MEISENQDFDDLDKWVKNAIRDDFVSYVENGGFGYKKDLTQIQDQFKHTTRCIKKLTTLLKVEQEKNNFLQMAIEHQSKQIESICREIILLKDE